MPKKKKEVSEVKLKEQNKVEKILSQRDYFLESSRSRRQIWTECWQAYVSWSDQTKNPFLANLYIPKTHEAVELLAAFLVGTNQTIKAEPKGRADTKKAEIIGKVLSFIWDKQIKARDKIVTWVKQGILFGNGILKVGWADGKPFMEVISISDVYFDYYQRDIQDSAVIHRIIRKVSDIKTDEKYNVNKANVVSMSEFQQDEENSKFSSYDGTILAAPSEDSTEIFEHWTKDKITVIAPTSAGYTIIRETDNPYKDSDGKPFIPFVKLRLKTNPLPNRAYDIGAIEPTIKIQKAFNDLFNEFFDNVSLINNNMWIERKGASISPMDLVLRPGGRIKVTDINNDIRPVVIPDIKQSILVALEKIDNEFQQASMVVNLLKGVPGADTATEASLGQQNVQTLLDLIDRNVKDALSEAGQMLVEIILQYIDQIDEIKVIDNDQQVAFMEVSPDEIQGKYDIEVSADRTPPNSKVVRQKQLLDLLAILRNDQMIMQKYPDLSMKIYKKWLEEAGFGDTDFFFQEQQMPPQGMPISAGEAMGLPARGQGLTPQGIQQSTQSPLSTQQF